MVAIRWTKRRHLSCSFAYVCMFLRSVKSHPLLRYPRSFHKSDAHSMHRMITIDTSPPQARWMKDTLDRSAFHRTVPVLAARVPAAKTGLVLKAEALRGSAHSSSSRYSGPVLCSRAYEASSAICEEYLA